MYGSLDIAVSGMVAQRTRINTIAANLANQSTIADAQGNPSPYRRRFTIFAPGDPSATNAAGRSMGVHVRSIEVDRAPPKKRWEPDSRFAQPEGSPDAGYVYYPNIDSVTEQVNAQEAQRAYEANVQAAEAAKSMTAQALQILA